MKNPISLLFSPQHKQTVLKVILKWQKKMETLAKQQPGFIGIESARDDLGITVSYWDSLDAIKNWKQESEHIIAQQKGREHWYNWYHVRICKVEREYEFLRK